MLNFHQKELDTEFHDIAKTMYLNAGQELLRENSYVHAIPILNSGLLGVYRTDQEGKEILLYYIKPGESCIMSFLSGIHNDTSKVKAVAEEDSELILIPVDKVSAWVTKYPEWTDYIFKLYHRRFEELLNVVNSIAFQRMDERLIEHLNKKASMTGSKELNVTHQQLADELGSSREVISRLLKQLEKEGKLLLSRNKISLL
jgi:CRP/FNR family transcriptional regulator